MNSTSAETSQGKLTTTQQDELLAHAGDDKVIDGLSRDLAESAPCETDAAEEATLLRAEIGRLHGEIDRLNALLADLGKDIDRVRDSFGELHPLRLVNEDEFARQSAATLGVPASILAHPDADLHH